MVEFKPMAPDEVSRLKEALHQTVDGKVAITMQPGDGSFDGTSTEEVSDLEVARAIRSVPCHY